MSRLFSKVELHHLWPFYLADLLGGLGLMVMPYMVVYFRSLDFSFWHISLITASFSISTMLFEVITGSFADRHGRKRSVLLGLLLAALALCGVGLTSHYGVILLALVMAGIAITFISGADEAWVVDNLMSAGQSALIQTYLVKHQSLTALGALAAFMLAPVVLDVLPMRALWFFWAAGLGLMAVVLGVFADEYGRPPSGSAVDTAAASLWRTARNGGRFVWRHSMLLVLVFGSMFASLLDDVADNAEPPFLVLLGMPQAHLGFYYAALALIAVVAPLLSRWLAPWPLRRVLVTSTLATIVFTSALVFVHPPMIGAALVLLSGKSFMPMMVAPVVQSHVHKWVPQEMRATVLSVQNMSAKLAVGVGSLGTGALMDFWGVQETLVFSAVFGLGAIVIFWRMREEDV